MRLIDEKGRLFGKINVIDFLVILFLVCLLPMGYFGYKIMTKKPVVVEAPKIEIETDCQFIKLKPELLEVISVGDKELDAYGQVIGEIISLGESSPYQHKLDIGGGQRIIKEDPLLKQLEAKLKLKTAVKDNNLYYKGKEVKIGLLLEFNTDKYGVVAIPTITPEEKEARVTLKVRFINLMPEISNVVKIGDMQIELTKENEKIISKVTKIILNEPAEFIQLIPTGKDWSITGHPKNRELVLEIETLCIRKPQGLFLSDRPMKIGSDFEFSTDLYSISGTIIEIEEK